MARANRAADFERRRLFIEAAELFDGEKDWAAAARCYEAALRSNAPTSLSKEVVTERCAERLTAIGRAEDAIRLCADFGAPSKGAELRKRLDEDSGVRRRPEPPRPAGPAPRVTLAPGPRQEALRVAQACEQRGDPLRAAELYWHAGDLETAASLFVRGGALRKAAEVHRAMGDLPGAIELLLQHGADAEAGALFEEQGDLERAAELFRKAGAHAGLARVLEKQNHLLAAARTFAQAGLPEEALRVIALLPAPVRARFDETLLAASCHLRLGKAQKAVALVRPLLAQRLSDPRQRCDASYLLGLAYESLADAVNATACFEQIVAQDPQFRDAALHLAKLKAQSTPPAPTVLRSSNSGATAVPALPSRYQIESKLGEGSMGTVYRARDTVLERWVAVKLLNREFADNARARGYFVREARAAGVLSHPNIITLYDAGVEGSSPYLVLEYLQGVDLETLSKRGPIPEDKVILYMRQLAEALVAVHDQGIVHRDIKPANVMVIEKTDTVKLMDFGIAHLVDPKVDRKATMVAGTPDFMAPEQFVGVGLGPWTDLYAFGGTVYELLTGKVPYPDANPMTVLDPPDPRAVRPETPAALAELVVACLQREPSARPQDARSVLQVLVTLSG